MPKHGKKYNEIVKNTDLTVYYDPDKAVELVKANAKAKFDETVELAIHLNLDPRRLISKSVAQWFFLMVLVLAAASRFC